MKVKVVKDATLTVTAGQTVDIPDAQFALAKKLGLVEEVKEKPKKKQEQ